jgi:glycosyltransferase involved in cell wall biosynthesis
VILHKIIWKSIIQYCLSSISQIYCISPSAKDLCVELYNVESKRIEYLYLGVESIATTETERENIRQIVRTQLGVPNDDFLIITGGKINPSKRIEIIVQAVQHINNIKVQIIVFGSPDPGFEDYYSRLKGNNIRIHMVGWCNSETINQYYLAADLAVFLGGQSVLWQQSIAAGLPGLFRKWAGHEHLNQGNCIYIYTNLIEEVEQWLRILTDRGNGKILDAMRIQAKTLAEGEMSYRTEAERIVARYIECRED